MNSAPLASPTQTVEPAKISRRAFIKRTSSTAVAVTLAVGAFQNEAHAGNNGSSSEYTIELLTLEGSRSTFGGVTPVSLTRVDGNPGTWDVSVAVLLTVTCNLGAFDILQSSQSWTLTGASGAVSLQMVNMANGVPALVPGAPNLAAYVGGGVTGSSNIYLPDPKFQATAHNNTTSPPDTSNGWTLTATVGDDSVNISAVFSGVVTVTDANGVQWSGNVSASYSITETAGYLVIPIP